MAVDFSQTVLTGNHTGTVTINTSEYRELLKDSAILEAVRGFASNHQYLDNKDIRILLGIEASKPISEEVQF